MRIILTIERTRPWLRVQVLRRAHYNDVARMINRRATIEEAMSEAATGKRPMPDAETLRLWSIALGVPRELWSEQVKAAVKRPTP